jgi:hypothetical protein
MTARTDVYLACHCPECDGREVIITARQFKSLSRIPSPAHERAIHQLVSRGVDPKTETG